MKIADLSPDLIARIRARRFDQIVEKHEGPESWDWLLKDPRPEFIEMMKRDEPDFDPIGQRPEFLDIGGRWALLPIGRSHHPNLTVLHHFASEGGQKLVIYLKDTTYDDDAFGCGFVAICDRWEPEGFYLSTFYHEWFVIDYDPMARRFQPQG